MTPAYVASLGRISQTINVNAQKIDGSALKTYKMVTIGFSVDNKLGRARFFEETSLLTNNSMEVILKMPFLSFSNTNLQFETRELT